MPDITTSESHGRSSPSEVVCAAYHEAGHALATVTAFRDAAWLPFPPPPVLVRHVEIGQTASGQWNGNCHSKCVYSVQWPESRIAPRYRDLMERQIVIHLAGGVAESIQRGERRPHEVLSFATRHCSMDTDLKHAAAVLSDLHRLTGRRFDAQHFADRTLALLLTHWPAVEAMANALIVSKRIEGRYVEQIIDHAMSAS